MACLVFVACGGAAVPNRELASAESAIRAAEVGGATELPKGELHLKYARDQVASARKLMEEGENEAATLVLERAIVDAELALALAEEEGARREAEVERDRIKELTAK